MFFALNLACADGRAEGEGGQRGLASSTSSSTTRVVDDVTVMKCCSSKQKSSIITMVPVTEMIIPGVEEMTRSYVRAGESVGRQTPAGEWA